MMLLLLSSTLRIATTHALAPEARRLLAGPLLEHAALNPLLPEA